MKAPTTDLARLGRSRLDCCRMVPALCEQPAFRLAYSSLALLTADEAASLGFAFAPASDIGDALWADMPSVNFAGGNRVTVPRSKRQPADHQADDLGQRRRALTNPFERK